MRYNCNISICQSMEWVQNKKHVLPNKNDKTKAFMHQCTIRSSV
jgi:hypothetical protein